MIKSTGEWNDTGNSQKSNEAPKCQIKGSCGACRSNKEHHVLVPERKNELRARKD